MKLIVWLGNPWKEYSNTRHNVGFIFVDLLKTKLGFSDWKSSAFNAEISEGLINWEKVILMKPSTYMNTSGEAVASIVDFSGIDISNILIISDDIDMEFGKLRFKINGSSGWQNGLKSIFLHLATEEIKRCKVGIGRNDKMSVSDWVLSEFTKEELIYLKENVATGLLKHIEEFLKVNNLTTIWTIKRKNTLKPL